MYTLGQENLLQIGACAEGVDHKILSSRGGDGEAMKQYRGQDVVGVLAVCPDQRREL